MVLHLSLRLQHIYCPFNVSYSQILIHSILPQSPKYIHRSLKCPAESPLKYPRTSKCPTLLPLQSLKTPSLTVSAPGAVSLPKAPPPQNVPGARRDEISPRFLKFPSDILAEFVLHPSSSSLFMHVMQVRYIGRY
jgi:hypothetical protein